MKAPADRKSLRRPGLLQMRRIESSKSCQMNFLNRVYCINLEFVGAIMLSAEGSQIL